MGGRVLGRVEGMDCIDSSEACCVGGMDDVEKPCDQNRFSRLYHSQEHVCQKWDFLMAPKVFPNS